MHRVSILLLLTVFATGSARAGEPWLAPGDLRLRHDLQMLADDGVINLPLSGWPIAVSDVAAALSRVRESGSTDDGSGLSPAQAAAVARLRVLVVEGRPAIGTELRAAARPIQLRTFDDTPREEAEFDSWVAGFVGKRWGGRLELSVVADPEDGNVFRYDGSYASGIFGNWIVTLGAQDRWWGSGWEGSLILSNSARPVPAISLDRAVSEPFETRWLSWIGPWRLTTFMGYMEAGRHDYNHPLLFGARVSARPLDGLELSLERTAQWCGDGRSCTWKDFWNLWTGRDNAGENVDPEDEPGNQLAGWDVRWASPIGDWNYALYGQHTGEAINNYGRPDRALYLAGVETWGDAGTDGGSWRAGFEWARSRCSGTRDGEIPWDCAYNSAIFNVEGYRSKGRPLGHSMDGDGQMYSLRFIRVEESSSTLSVLFRFTQVNEGGVVPDTRHTVAPGPEDWLSLDFSYRRPLVGGWVEAGVGADYRDRDWNDSTALLPRAWVTWEHQFE